MTFEQPATLNRFVAEPVPINWASRWKAIRLYLPLLAFMTICLAERLALAMWTHDRFKPVMLLLAFLPSAMLLAFALISYEFKLRGQNGMRFLGIFEKGISLMDTKCPAIRWANVVAFWFEDMPDSQEFKKITVEYFGNKKRKFPRRYSLALTKRDQCPALLSELHLLQQQHNLNVRVELDRSLPSIPEPRNPVLGMSLGIAGLLFLLHGVPLLLVPLTHNSGAPHHSDTDHKWSPRAQEAFANFVKVHFSSANEFHRFVTVIGAVLTLIGVGLMVAGHLVSRQKADEAPPAPQLKSTQASL